eukprot:jgi/Ulvmu1/9787/UM056_0027.1
MSNVNRGPGMGSGKKVLAAPNMGRSMNITEDDALECWGVLESAIQQIHEQNASRLSFEELYRRAYTLVLHRYGAMLYTGFESSLRNHLTNVRAKFTDKSGMAFVSEVLVQWSTYHKSTQMIRDILMYMDRTFVKNFNRTPVYARGMEIWTEEVIRNDDVGVRLLSIFLEQVDAERNGDVIIRGTLEDVTKMMLELGKAVYIQELEAPFLKRSKDFFLTEVQRCLATMNCPEYFEMVEHRLQQEEERACAVLDQATSKGKLLRLVDDVFVAQQLLPHSAMLVSTTARDMPGSCAHTKTSIPHTDVASTPGDCCSVFTRQRIIRIPAQFRQDALPPCVIYQQHRSCASVDSSNDLKL